MVTSGIAAATRRRIEAAIVRADSVAGGGKASNRYEMIEICMKNH
jgi:hypothetical protein